MQDLLPAICLLTAFPGDYSPPPCPDDWPALRESVHRVAVGMEILDPRETGYLFAKLSDYEPDLNTLRRRYHELRDAPRLADAERLPPRPLVVAMIQFNREYRNRLDNRRDLELDRYDVLSAAICETDECYRVMDYCRDATCPYFFTVVRRHALMRLRDSLTEEEWATVSLPPPVPLHRFQE